MTKAHNKTGSQKSESAQTNTSVPEKSGSGASSNSKGTSQPTSSKEQPASSISIQTDKAKINQSSKSNKSAIGGTAVPGAKSTQPKELKATTQAQQEAESYNREMRRRMQHMGAGPYGGSQTDAVRNRRQKRIDKRKQHQEEVKKTVVAKGPSTNIKLGRKNTYFVLGTLALIVLIIVIALIIRHPF